MEGFGKMSPTKGNLLATQKSLQLANTGYELMDKKRNILIRELMTLLDEAETLQKTIDTTYATAYKALQNANISMGTVQEIVRSIPIEEGLSIDYRSVMGAELPIVKLEESDLTIPYALSDSNPAFDEAYLSFHNVKLMLVELVQLENNIYRLATAIKQTQSRANALKNIIIPRYTETVKGITSALEEAEREEFTRLKVIKK